MTMVVAPAPPITTQATVEGIEIAYPKYNYVKVNTSFDLHTHIFNDSVSYLDNTTTDCYLHLYGVMGAHLYREIGNFSETMFDFEWEIPDTVFSKLGTHAYMIFCNATGLVGFASGEFTVTKTGLPNQIETTLTYFFSAVLLFVLALAIIFIINQLPSGDSVNDENEIVQFSQLKHLRSVLWVGVWGIFLMIVFIIGNFTLMYLTSDLVGNVFMTLFIFMMVVTVVGVPVWFIWIFYKMYRDAIKQKLLERGVSQFQSL